MGAEHQPGPLRLRDAGRLRTAEMPGEVVEQVIRPTGLVDPIIHVRPAGTQVPDLMTEIKKRVERKERVLVTTLTKRMAEQLSGFLREAGIQVTYLHTATSRRSTASRCSTACGAARSTSSSA